MSMIVILKTIVRDDMPKYYIAPNKRGRMIKIVEDVKIPVSDKLYQLGQRSEEKLTRQALVARFVNEQDCQRFLDAYNQVYGEGQDEEVR